MAVVQAAPRIGAVHVPVAGSDPPARLSLIVDSAAPVLVVSAGEVTEGAPQADRSGRFTGFPAEGTAGEPSHQAPACLRHRGR